MIQITTALAALKAAASSTAGRWLLYLAVAGAGALGYQAWAAHQQAIGEQRAADRCKLEQAEQRAQAAHTLATETRKVLARERELHILYTQQEATDADRLNQIERLRQQAIAAAQAAPAAQQPASPGSPAVDYQHDGRLRLHLQQPAALHRGGGTPGAAPAGAEHRAADAAETYGLLPARAGTVEAVEAVEAAMQRIDLATEAEQINAAYASCRAALLAEQQGDSK